MPTLDLVLVGFGNVARRFVRLLEEKRDRLHHDYDLDWRVVGIATRRHGCLSSDAGLDAVALAAHVEAGGSLESHRASGATQPGGAPALIASARATPSSHPRVVVETTTLDIRRGQPATDLARAALRAGAHVITANKGPVAFAYHELREEARRAGRRFLFEGTVMDGVPIFNLVRETLPGVEILGFRGVINSTTNYLLTAMERGQPFDEALAEMQARGIAEADPSLDVDGWDAAAKTAALMNVLMDARTTPDSIERIGVPNVTVDAARAAVARGRRIRLVASATREDGVATGRVAPVEIAATDPLALLEGTSNALVLETDVLGELTIVEPDAGLTHTAYALLSDLVAVATHPSQVD